MHPGEAIVAAITWYLRIGAGVAVLFVIGVGRVVPSAKGGSFLFRLLVLPGATLLWPLVLVRSVRAIVFEKPPAEHGKESAHG